ncbi:MAG: tetratricopeptide repeat protein [Rhodospirillales bacterium]
MSHPGTAKPRPGASPAARDLAAAVQRHQNGRLGEAADLYRRVLAREPRQADALHLLGLLEHGRGRHGEALALIERAIAANARIAAFHIAHGTVLGALGQPDSAADALARALAIDPAHPEALNALGNLRLAAGDAAAAVEAYRQAFAARPDYVEALSNLGSALRAQGRLAEAETTLRQAISLRPAYVSALANLGLVLQEQARWDEALATYDAALAADGAHPAARGNRAMLLLLLGRLEEGFAEYEARWQMPGFSTRRRDLGCAAWDGSPLDGQTLLVHAEQGLGSAIQFVRYAALAASRGARVVLESQAPLLRLFRQSLVGTGLPVEAVIRKGEALPSCDRQAPLMSLPHLLGTTLESIPADIPYLSASADDVAAWRQRLAATPMPRIGLVWAGNARHENDHNRSMPAASLAPLVAGTAASFFSLQVPAKPDDLDSLPPGRVTDLSAQLRDFADTAAVGFSTC